jgi:hypothetical protein
VEIDPSMVMKQTLATEEIFVVSIEKLEIERA